MNGGCTSEAPSADAAATKPDVQVLAIGASTGGPQALMELLKPIAGTLTVPVLIAQHIPTDFAPVLADSMGRTLNRSCTPAQDGDRVAPGHIYLARGDRHMSVCRDARGVAIKLLESPPVHHCRPAVDPLFLSVAEVYGHTSLCVVLTGMGQDGLEGARAIAAAGGSVFAQDEASSVVWGMPGAVARAGLCDLVGSVSSLSRRIGDLMRGGAP